MKPILVTSYVNPDLDGVAGMIAYTEFLQNNGKDAVAGIIGEPHEEAKYMLNRFGCAYPERIPNADDFDEVILVDASDPNVLEGRVPLEKVIEIIDHRQAHDAATFPKAKVNIELVGAAATLVAERFMQGGTVISQKSATLLYGAIISNTLNFKASITTGRDSEVAVWLNRVAKLPEPFWRELFLAKSDLSGAKLAECIESDLAWRELGGKRVSIAQIEVLGVKKLIEERSSEIIRILEKLKAEMQFDHIFLNAIDLEDSKNFYVASDSKTKELLEKVLRVRFSGDFAERPDVLMRKQIIPLLKEELEK